MKLIMVTAFIFSLGEAFSQTTISQTTICLDKKAQTLAECVKFRTCKIATEEALFQYGGFVECSCGATPSEPIPNLELPSSNNMLGTPFFARTVEVVEANSAEGAVEDALAEAKSLCFYNLTVFIDRVYNEQPKPTLELKDACNSPSICYEWHDTNKNGIEDPGEIVSE